MPRPTFAPLAQSHVDSRLRPWLRCWLAIGLILTVCVPASRDHSLWIGWLPYWLVFAPLLCLVVLNRRSLLLIARERISKSSRRRSTARPQARRQRVRFTSAQLTLAALLTQPGMTIFMRNR